MRYLDEFEKRGAWLGGEVLGLLESCLRPMTCRRFMHLRSRFVSRHWFDDMTAAGMALHSRDRLPIAFARRYKSLVSYILTSSHRRMRGMYVLISASSAV